MTRIEYELVVRIERLKITNEPGIPNEIVEREPVQASGSRRALSRFSKYEEAARCLANVTF